ncbi:MAG TPA: hypothetical protein VHX15_00305 [Frankiaceae bacterium]|nr:hypothetical protein [Frankiaceae bacterium]
MRASRPAALPALFTGLSAAVMVACSSGTATRARSLPTPSKLTGEAGKRASTIVSDARAALLAASSVHVKGAFTHNSTSDQRLDLQLTRVNGQPAATGTVTTVTRSGAKSQTVTLALIRLGGRLYVRGDRAYYARIGPKAAAVAGHWLVLPIAQDKSVADLTDLATLAAGLASASSDRVQGVSRIGTHRVVVVAAGAGATLYVLADGPSRPIRLQRSGASAIAGTIDFSDYNAPLKVAGPAGAIDIAKVRG